MLRPFLMSTACVLFLMPIALGQGVPTPAAPSELEQSGLTPPTVLSGGYAITGSDTLVTQLLTRPVYTSIEDDAEQIGSIVDLVVTPGVGISAVVLGVGGFLGIGAKDVAIDFTQLQWLRHADGSHRWVLATTAEALIAAPAFIWTESEETTGTPALTPTEEEEQLVDGNPNATTVDPALTTDQPERQVTSATMDRSGLSALDTAGITTEQMIGIGVYGVNDEQIGTIGDVILNADGSFDAVVVDVGGFLGLGAKPVAVGAEGLTFSADTEANRYLFINATRDQLEAQPVYDAQTYEQDRASQRMVVTP